MRQALFRPLRPLLVAIVALALVACETTTKSGAVGVERKQMMAVSSQEIEAEAGKEYGQLMAQARQKGLLNQNPTYVSRVRAVSNRLIAQTGAFRPDALHWNWEVNVLSTPEINAWAMPGGKVAVYTGLIEKLNITDDELAAVLGHEIAHALREHSRERASEQMVADSVISIGSALFGVGQLGQMGAEYAYMGLLGLPHSRGQETEADRIGVELAARAGYDPRAAITLWQKMGKQSGSEPLKFLSTHPSSSDRQADLASYSAKVMPLYERAKKQ